MEHENRLCETRAATGVNNFSFHLDDRWEDEPCVVGIQREPYGAFFTAFFNAYSIAHVTMTKMYRISDPPPSRLRFVEIKNRRIGRMTVTTE